MSIITLTGLTKRQKAFAEIVWNIDSADELASFVVALPPKQRQECETVLEMIRLAALDEIESVHPEVTDMINSIIRGS